MSFWDSSALLSLVLDEAQSNAVRELWDADEEPIVWWGSLLECYSALARRIREGLADEARSVAEVGIRALADFWEEIPPTDAVRNLARGALIRHQLRAADSLQLAAALVAADGEPASLRFVCLDDRLREAARAEGFSILP